MLRRLLGNFFCIDKYRFRAAEAVISTVFHHKVKENKDNFFLTDKVIDRLNRMFNEKLIDQKTLEEMKNMFIRGMEFKISDYKQQKFRLQIGKDKQDHLAFNLDPVILSLILNLKYKLNKQGKLQINDVAPDAFLIVGTPGLGKSFKLIASKVLHDMRIRYIINRKIDQQESIFTENFKYIYIDSKLQIKQILKQIMNQVKKDFDQIPESLLKYNILQTGQEKNFLRKVSFEYEMKSVKLRLIIDQVNKIYNMDQNQRAYYINNWITSFYSIFQKPAIMVSSKNNIQLKNYDPVKYFAGSTKTCILHKKVILDNLISPQERLAYSYSCLIFQLQKGGWKTSKIINMLSQYRFIFPLLTHLQVRNAVQSQKYLQRPIRYSEQANVLFMLKLREKLNLSYIFQSIKSLKDQTNFQVTSQKNINLLSIISNLLIFSCKETEKYKVKLSFKIKDQNNQESKLDKFIQVPRKQIKNYFDEYQNLQYLAEANYFFTYRQNNSKKLYLYTSTSVEVMEKLRVKLMTFISTQFIKNLRQHSSKQIRNFLNNNVGFIFQLFICYSYWSALQEKYPVYTQLNLFGKKQSYITYTYFQQHFSILNETCIKKLFSKQSKNLFIKSSSGNPSFDFIICNNQKNNFKLLLVDMTISSNKHTILNKISKFKIELQNFRKIIKETIQNNSSIQVSLIYYVLTAEPLNIQILKQDDLRHLQSQFLMQLKQQKKKPELHDDQLTRIDKHITLIENGQKAYNNFKNQFMNNQQVEVSVKFGSGVFNKQFKIVSQKYKEYDQNQIKNLPLDLLKIKKELRRIYDQFELNTE